MTTIEDTDRLVRALAANPRTRFWTLRGTLAAAVAVGAALALAASLSLLVTGADLADAVQHRWLYQKVICMAAIVVGTWPIVEDLAAPDPRPTHAIALLPALLLLVTGAIVDPGGVALVGRSAWSAPACTISITLLSIPVLALVLAALRSAAAPARPALAGLAAGLLAGAIGAIAYAFACRNNGGAFILLWYGAALSIVAAIGAVAGRWTLAW